ncbi:unnamed protein product, partial [marine sediment metagenome]
QQSQHGRRLVGTWGNARWITLRPSKPPDADDWENVGYFRKVMWTKNTDPRALQIWKAYKNDTELPEDCNILDNADKANTLETDWTRSSLDNQLLFENFY